MARDRVVRKGPRKEGNASIPSTLPLPLSSHSFSGWHSFPPLRSQKVTHPKNVPGWAVTKGHHRAPLSVSLPGDPKGLTCKSLFSGLCVFSICSTLLAPAGSGPSASPCLSLQTQVSCVCRQSLQLRGGLGQAEGTFPGNSGGNGWEGRGDHLISRDSASQSRAERVRGPWPVPRGQWLWVVTRGGSQAGRNLLFEKWRKPAGAER